MNEKNKPLQSQSDDGMAMLGSVRSHHRIWLQTLGVILLLCVLGGGFFWIQILRAPHDSTPTIPYQNQHGLCIVPNVPFNGGAPVLNAVVAVSARDAWAVGSYERQPLIEYWNGQHWMMQPNLVHLSQPGILYSVAANSTNDIWAVGAFGSLLSSLPYEDKSTQPLIEHWDGHTWNIALKSATLAASGAVLLSVTALTTDDAWAVGYQMNIINGQSSHTALVEHWNGHQWSAQPLPSTLFDATLTAVTAISQDDIWVVGYTSVGKAHQPLVEHWNGHQWSAQPLPSTLFNAILTAVTAISQDDIWVVGYKVVGQVAQPLIEHWDGHQWNFISSPQLTGGGLLAVHAVSPNDVWAVGGSLPWESVASRPPALEHWNGRNWNIMPQKPSEVGTLSGVTFSNGKLWAVGTSYAGYQQIPNALIESNTC